MDGASSRVTHGVSENVRQRVGREPQGLHAGIILIDGVGESTGGIEHKAAARTIQCRAKRAGRRAEADRADRLGVACIWIGVVGEDVAGGR